MVVLELSLLGPFSATFNDQPLNNLRITKAQALLIYLAVEKTRQHRREHLFTLLWPGMPESSARNNFRQVLYALRNAIPDTSDSRDSEPIPLLLADRQTLQLNPNADVIIDIHQLENLIHQSKHHDHADLAQCNPCVQGLEQAVNLYRGKFLSDFYLEDSNVFEDWVEAVRGRCENQILDVFSTLADIYIANQDFDKAQVYIDQQLEIDDLRENAQRQQMEVLALWGRRVEALRHYREYTQMLESELDVAPSQEITDFYERIRREDLIGKLPSKEVETTEISQTRNNLIPQLTPFIGRQKELVNLDAMFDDPTIRLITIMGSGGMGKTRLAIAYAEQQLAIQHRDGDGYPFMDGVFFVPLEDVEDPDQIPFEIMKALNPRRIAKQELLSVEQQLLGYLRRKRVLLVLDHFEQLVVGPAFLTKILQTAPNVQLLVTSRERLNLQAEQVFPISGLIFPKWGIPDNPIEYTAIQLFLESARRVRPDFDLTAGDIVHLTYICRQVGGMPLGLKLAASWVDILSLNEIAAEVQRGIDLLETNSRDVPAQQRSIRAMFDHSWNLLIPPEQEVFQSLAIFRGGCKRGAAQEIVGASLRDLKSLVNKSMLEQTLNGRYDIHEISRKYAAEKLRESPDGGQAIRRRHSIYYTTAIQAWGDDLKSERLAVTLKEMDMEIGNIQSAWNWAVAEKQIALLDQSMEGIRHYYAIRRRILDAERVFREAAEHLKAMAEGDERRIYARLLCTQGFFTVGYEGKRELYQRSLAVLEELEEGGEDVRFEKALVQNYLGHLYDTGNQTFLIKKPDYDEALRLYKGSLRLFQELRNRYWMADVLQGIGIIYYMVGDLDEAQKNFERSLEIWQEIGDPMKVAENLNNLDVSARRQGNFEKAERLARQALAIYERIGDIFAIADAENDLGIVLLLLGKFQGAHARLEDASATDKEMENFQRYLHSTFYLCWTKMHMGWYSQVLDVVRSTLDWYQSKAGEGLEAFKAWYPGKAGGGYLTGFSLSVQGAAYLALGRTTEAERFFQESIASYLNFTITEAVRPYSMLGALYTVLGQLEMGRGYLLLALEKGIEINSAIVHIFTLPGVALLLAKNGDLERAVEIYALAARYPWIDKSQWYQDIILSPLTTKTKSLPPRVIADAQKRGRERDLVNTIQELLAALA
jgi:DNA-binding SARP family transcriptional activator/predicted ATPase